tara:strand:- start:56 stop:418 length:363 start_codon:yes stop_codon:yes gene_type:complete
MKNYVYFSESTHGGAAAAVALPAENFMGIDYASDTTAKIYFKPIVHLTANTTDGDENMNVLVTFPDVTTAGNLNFAQICEVITGAIVGSKPSGAMTVIADELNSNYISPLTGTVTVTAGG